MRRKRVKTGDSLSIERNDEDSGRMPGDVLAGPVFANTELFCYSYRNATMGSTRIARRAGM